jgi:hypothetical protein
MHRLETEKEILRTEAQGRGASVTGPLAVWRHGAQGHGLPGCPELGLSSFTPDDLRAWVARFFTRDNAMLWIAGDDVPAGLSLRLPGGTRHAVPTATSALTASPAFFPGATGVVAWDTVLPRSTCAAVFSDVLQRVLFRELRQEDGLSYTAQADYRPRGDGMAVVTAVADALPAKQDAALGGFVDVLARMGLGRIAEDDVRAVVGKRLAELQNADIDASRLPGAVFDLLTEGRTTGTPHLLAELAELAEVTPETVARVAAAAMRDGLLMTPEDRGADWAGFAAAPSTFATSVAGTAYLSRESPDARVVVGYDGVSVVDGDETTTVRYSDCAAMLAWPDGARALIGADALTVHLEPTLYRALDTALPGIDAAVPAQTKVTMPARDPAAIPVADDTPDLRTARRVRDTAVLQLALAGLSVVSFALSALFAVRALSDDGDDDGAQLLRGLFLIVAVLSGYASSRVRRRLQAHGR